MNLPEFHQPPRAIALDLDGTLLNGRTQMSDRNRLAVERCIGNGIPVIIATSRASRSVRHLIGNELADICSLVMLNGAIAAGNPPLSGYHREILPDEIARGIIEYALSIAPQTRVTIELDGYKFGVNWTADPEQLRLRNSATADMVISLDEALELQPSKIALGGIGDRILDLAVILKERYEDSISIVHSFYEVPLLMVTTTQATKPAAIRRLLSPHNISLDSVLAIGDDIPDIEMLQECGIPVAMENAVPEVKAICSYETASNDDDGVAIILERITEAAGK
jgi:Cof subfamily protein (haloacid dehalogenase superfamily)